MYVASGGADRENRRRASVRIDPIESQRGDARNFGS
jgi:hypothetical protein